VVSGDPHGDPESHHGAAFDLLRSLCRHDLHVCSSNLIPPPLLSLSLSLSPSVSQEHVCQAGDGQPAGGAEGRRLEAVWENPAAGGRRQGPEENPEGRIFNFGAPETSPGPSFPPAALLFSSLRFMKVTKLPCESVLKSFIAPTRVQITARLFLVETLL